nr:sensor histidine kinase [Chloroflexota bacterium]
MTPSTPSRRADLLMTVSAYLVLAAVAALGVYTISDPGHIPAVAALLIAFGLFFLFPHPPQWQRHLYLLAQTAIVVTLSVLEPHSYGYPILFFMLSAQASIFFPQRPALLWVGLFTAATAVVFTLAGGWQAGLIAALPYASGYFFFGVFSNALYHAESARRESQSLLEQLQVAHRRLQDYAAQAQTLAVAEERNRLAREVHDSLGHRLTVSAVQLEGAQRLITADPDRAAKMIGNVREEVRQALADLRRTVAALRAPLDTDLPLAPALTKLAADFQEATGVTVHAAIAPDLPTLPDAARLAIYRVAQEGLTNAQRHARATEVWLDLRRNDGQLALTVRDNGAGLAAGEEAGFGLLGLRERAAQLGGRLQLQPLSNGGAELRFDLPVNEAR